MSNKYLYKNFEDYMEYSPFDKNHPMIKAFELIWNMARVPEMNEEQTPTPPKGMVESETENM